MAPQPASSQSSRVTLSDIARMAGVSRQVVSAICGVSGASNVRYSPRTRERVQQIVRETRFRANRTAKNLVQKRHGALGILVVNFGHLHEQVLRTMLLEAHGRGQMLVLDTMLEGEQVLPVFLREDSVDGLIVFEDIDDAIEREIERLAVPCVRVNTNMRAGPGCITFDEIGAMRLAVDHFIACGRRNLAILEGRTRHYSQRMRTKGMRDAAAKRGLAPVEVLTFNEPHYYGEGSEETFRQTVAFFKRRPHIDGVMLSVDAMAPVFYRAAGSLGRSIPGDIAVAGVNNSAIALGVYPALTSLFVEPRHLGRRIVTLLNERIDDLAGAQRSALKIPYQLIVRGSSPVSSMADTEDVS